MELKRNLRTEILALEREQLRLGTQLNEVERELRNVTAKRQELIGALNILERHGFIDEPVIKEADPELERLLAEEEEIERLARERQQQNPWGQ